jgi:tRNA 2-thiouridine synthesizing protein A
VARRRLEHQQKPAATVDAAARQRYDVFLDARGLACPMPLIKTRQALMVVERGATVCVLATDPDSVADFTSFCEATGHRLVQSEQRHDIYLFVVEKA